MEVRSVVSALDSGKISIHTGRYVTNSQKFETESRQAA
jgi:hypothetical protein